MGSRVEHSTPGTQRRPIGIPALAQWMRHWTRCAALSQRSLIRTLRTLGVSLVLVVTLLVGANSPLAQGLGIGSSATAHAAPAQGTPHHVDPTSGTKSVLHRPPASKLPPFTPQTQRPPMSHGFVPSMKPGLLKLDPTKDTQFTGSDGRLEIDVPAGAVNAADVAAAAGGTLSLRITEIAPPSGSNAGSAVVSLGSYAVEVVDGQGNRVAQFANGLRKGLTLKLHYGTKDSALDLDRAFVVFNGAHPSTLTNLGPYSTQPVTHDRTNHVLQAQLPADPTLAASPTATPTQSPTQSPAPVGSPTHVAPTGAPAARAGAAKAALAPLSPLAPLAPLAPLTQQTPLTTFTFDSYPPVAKFGSPDPLNVDLNSGGLTEGLQLDVPPGPAQAMPNITLAYNSGAVSEQHSPQGAAGWVGEGWSLSLGSITWAEHTVAPTCTSSCNISWGSSWQLTDPFGTSTELIPPNLAAATYYDDSENKWCTTGLTSADTCPIQFQTARETYAKVYAYVGPNLEGSAPDPFACFRVYLTNGVMEEFGCTADSLQYYPIQANSLPGQTRHDVYYPVAWLLDLITNPQGDQVHLTYQSDSETAPDGLTYPRDTVLSTIEWDSPDCVSATQGCSSSSWHPHYRVSFSASHHTVSRLTNSPTGCNSDTSVRCDDPLNLTGSGKIGAPLVNGTFVLNDANVQTNPSGNGGSYTSGTWNTVRDYQFSYEQSGPTTITDPATGMQVSTAGYLDLTQLKQVGDDGSTAYPATVFSYTSQTQYYEDGSYTPYSTTFCGPSWNTGGNGGTCDLWSQSRDGNSRYLSSVSNGQGLQQTVSWANARNNTHGVNSPGSPADPLYCTNNQTSTYPCNSADDQAWSRMVVTGRSDSVLQLTQAGQGGQQTSTPVTSTYGYTYQLSYPLAAQECTDCVAGMEWGNQNDGDYLDYYNGHFMGFAQASVSNPDGSVVVHKYEATQGWGVYDTSLITSCPSALPPASTTCHAAPWWNLANAGHGLEYETDAYDTNGTTLLKKVTATYSAVCPPSGVSATPTYSVDGYSFGPWDGEQVSEVDRANPVATCDVQQTQQVTTTYNGTTNSVTDTEANTYDSYGRVTQAQSTSNSGGGSGSSASPTTIYDKTSYVWNDGLTVPAAQRTTTNQESAWGGAYLIDLTALATTEDSSGNGNRYSCHYTGYDGLAATSTGQQNTLTAGNVTEQDTYTSCGSAPNYTPSGKVGATTSYDGYGNATGMKDPDATNGDTSHQGATGTTCAGSTSCAQYDPTSQAKATLSGNLANQTATAGYNAATDPAGGYGLWPTSTTDANGQTTTAAYDALGRMTSQRAPGQSSGPATEALAYANWCSGTSAQSPCVETDTTKRLDSSTTVTTRRFSDGAGRLVETRTAAPGSHDVVQYTLYNAAGEAATSSVQYFVTAYTGAAGSAAYSIPDSTQVVATATYDGLSRTLSVTDPLSNVTKAAYTVVCSAPGTGSDTGCYEQTLGTDANHHQQGQLVDGFGRAIYAQRYTGNSPSTYTLYTTTKQTYDYLGRVTSTLHPDGTHTTSSTYDLAGRITNLSDPDRGSQTYSYDANGNPIQGTDARGQTTYAGYDGLNRPIWRNTANNASGAYVTYSYDGSANGSYGTGRLSAEVFRGSAGTGATSFSGAYTFSYDALGRTTRTDLTMGGAGACPSGWTCADIGSVALAGSQSYAGDGLWTVSGGGTGIGSTSDQFHYVYQTQASDVALTAPLTTQTYTSSTMQAGLMVRASTAAGAPFYAVLATPGGVTVAYRSSTGGSTTQVTTGVLLPATVKLTRTSSTTYAAYTSADGVTWTPIGTPVTLGNLSGSVLAGVAASSDSASAVSLLTVANPATTTGGTGACPSGWTCQDIGSPALAGTQTFAGDGLWTVTGAGSDIYDTSDQFHYVSQSQAGDGSISVRVSSQTNTSSSAKAGVLFRASSAANAPFYDVVVRPNNTVAVQDRATAGGTAAQQAGVSGVSLPLYLQATRSGTTYSAATSTDGVTWTPISGSSLTLSNLSGSVLAGVAITSHNTGALSTATVDHLSPSATPPGTVTTTPLPTPAGVTSYPVQQSYDDGGLPISSIYPDGETVTTSYTGQGWLAGLSTTQNGVTTTLLGSASYSGAGGAAGQVTGANLGNGTNGVYQYSASYDALVRLTDTKLTRTSDSTVLFEQTRGYDAVSAVTSANTTLPAGTDNQAFCYDEFNRLTWASSASGSIPCGGTLTAGTLTSAAYTASYAYDTLDRLTSSPLGSYTYGDSAHLHAATAIGSAYTAAYDAAGNMTCRAPTSATTCAGTPTGAQLTYDTEGRLTAWQNTPSAPTSTDSFLYDGAGQRVEQQVTTSGTTTTTVYVGSVEEVSTTGGTTTTTTYYYAGRVRLALAVNGVFSYLCSDGLGSANVALDSSGNAQASALYGPYGTTRYTSGTMPGSYGFTGQRADATTGLDYYNARYYDPLAGQFVSADPVGDGLNLFAYVAGNPETLTDPTGLVTFGVCVGGSGGAGLGGLFSGCIVIGYDPSAGWSGGVTGTAGGGFYGGEGGGPDITGQFSTASTVDDLGGQFDYAGASGQAGPWGLTGTGFCGRGARTGRLVCGGNGGWQGGEGGGYQTGTSYTKVLDFSTIGSAISSAKHAARQQITSTTNAAHQQVAKATSQAHQQVAKATSQAHQQVAKATNWAHQQVTNATNAAHQQVAKATSWVHQQVTNATSWTNPRVTKWLNQQIDNASSWVNQQIDNTSSWVNQQVNNVSSWTNQQIDNTSSWVNQQIDNTSSWVNQQVNNVSNTVKGLLGWWP